MSGNDAPAVNENASARWQREIETLTTHWSNLAHNNVHLGLMVECFNCQRVEYLDVGRFYDVAQQLRRRGWQLDRLHTWWCSSCADMIPKYAREP